MNKTKKIFLSILGGIDVVFYMLTPIMLASIYISIAGVNTLSWLFFILGGLSTVFRAIKIGWMK